MRKGEIVELILQSIAGGQKTQDSGRYARKEDVDVYLAPAINFVQVKSYYLNRGDGERIFPNDFLATHILEVEYNAIEDYKFVPLPGKLLPLPLNRGLRSVGPVQGTKQFIQMFLEAEAHDEYYSGSTKSQTGFILNGQNIKLVNISPLVKEVKVIMVKSVEDLDDEEELPIPAGMELEVIDVCVQFFTGVRQLPKDSRPNNIEG